MKVLDMVTFGVIAIRDLLFLVPFLQENQPPAIFVSFCGLLFAQKQYGGTLLARPIPELGNVGKQDFAWLQAT